MTYFVIEGKTFKFKKGGILMSNYSENQKQTNRKKKYYIKWGNVALASLCLVLVFVLVYELFISDHELTVINNTPTESSKEDTISSKVEVSSKEDTISSKVEVSSNSRLSEREFDILVLAVQHEVGKTNEYNLYPNANFDYIQQAMASVIVNRIGDTRFGETIEEVLSQDGQFEGLLYDISHPENFKHRNQLNVNDARTRENCLKVLNNSSDLTDAKQLLFESSYETEDLQDAWHTLQSNYLLPLKMHYAYRMSNGCWFLVAGLE